MLIRVGNKRCSIFSLVNGLVSKFLIRSLMSELTNGSFVFLMNKAIANGHILFSIEPTNSSFTPKTTSNVDT